VLPDDEPPPTPSAPPPTATAIKPQPAESAELALFRRAQSLHLAKDKKAIAAWDAYLRVAGTSPLAPEARYNRALGLVRASRFTEAKSALAPFAQGKYGEYRRDEAQALIARLPK
jgi:TolA-binding protein